MPLYEADRIDLGKSRGKATFEASNDKTAIMEAEEGLDWKVSWVEVYHIVTLSDGAKVKRRIN